jgi:hypothetical protein
MSSEFPTTITTEDGYEYYTIPEGYPLYKASRNSKTPRDFKPERFYFFGVKNENPEYIESFEKEYGIIFEFKTGRPYKLLAMDKPATRARLYDLAPPEIKTILDDNYGRKNGIRYSIGEKDSEFSNYICLLGFDGYAIHTMETPTGGRFHSEFMICNTTSMEMVKRVTTDKVADEILLNQKLKEYAPKKKVRPTTRKSSPKSNVKNLFGTSPYNSSTKKQHDESPQEFMSNNKYPEAQNLFGTSPYNSSTKKQRVEFSQGFMSNNKSPEVQNLFGTSPISSIKSSIQNNTDDSSTVFTPNKSSRKVNKNLFEKSPVSTPTNKNIVDSTVFIPNKTPEAKNLFSNSIPTSSSRKTKRIRTPTPRTPTPQ